MSGFFSTFLFRTLAALFLVGGLVAYGIFFGKRDGDIALLQERQLSSEHGARIEVSNEVNGEKRVAPSSLYNIAALWESIEQAATTSVESVANVLAAVKEEAKPISPPKPAKAPLPPPPKPACPKESALV